MTAIEIETLTRLCDKYVNFFQDDRRPTDDPNAYGKSAEDIEDYLKVLLLKSGDSELLVMLAIVQLLRPLEDYDAADKTCLQLLSTYPDDHRANLIMAYNGDFYENLVSDETFARLDRILTSDRKITSARLYYYAKHCENTDKIKYREFLEEAVATYSGNLLAVSHLLFDSPLTHRSSQIAKEAILIAEQYSDPAANNPVELLSFDRFLSRRIFGIPERYDHIVKHAKYLQ